MRLVLVALLLTSLGTAEAFAQETARFTRADSLRGSITPERSWWDVIYYDLDVRVDPADSTIAGSSGITFRVVDTPRDMQIDLAAALRVDSVTHDGRRLTARRDGDVVYVTPTLPGRVGEEATVVVYYQGRPRVAANAPWDGGFVWSRDDRGNPWIATAVQGLGASAWWPTKDTQADEPDSQRVAITVPEPSINVSNGRLRRTVRNGDGTVTYEWFVSNPINNYNIAVNVGDYAHFSDVFEGEGGDLTLDFWPLAYNEAAAREQFQQTKPLLACFEHWFGPYPWYEDGFKVVETPHLGMEHQSAIAYGNGYQNGYRGRDLSATGHGLRWDFILVHEAGHEWFGNSITTRDIADMWVHEGFTNYSEGLYTECLVGKEAGAEYIIGSRRNIQNDAPIVGIYGVNHKGSGDMYYKGGSLLHMIRQVAADDELWRSVLRGLNEEFRHSIVTGAQVQEYISQRLSRDLSRVFAQYLTTAQIPALEYRVEAGTLHYRWADAVTGFDLPVRASLGENVLGWMHPTANWRQATLPAGATGALTVDDDFYVTVREID